MFIGAGMLIGSNVQGGKRVVIYDDFNRADSPTALGTSSSGKVWTQTGNMGIIDNQAYFSAGVLSLSHMESGRSDVSVKIKETAIGEFSKYSGLLFRYASNSNYFRAVFQDKTLYLQKYESSTTTTLGAKSITRNVDNILKVVAKGPSISVYVNDVLQLTLESSFNQSATRHGLVSAALNARYDDFTVVAI